MKKYKFIAVILVYRNSDDLIECIRSFNEKVESCQIIIVNAFYDEQSMKDIKSIADSNGCDFLNIENKGYGFGNNAGIEYANTHYEYEYVIISNPDTVIREFDSSVLSPDSIYAPRIISRSGKEQNPMVVRRSRLSEYLVYKGFKRNLNLLLILGILVSKVKKFFNCLFRTSYYRIYQAHGSFLIIHSDVIEKLHPIYDPNMFLFAEEGLLALKACKNEIRTFFVKDIIIEHKEDGSMSLADFKINDKLKEANVYFYETYCK